ncbi:MAG: TolC family protein [candidate division KSB1 bacterium]|nr:TolC family protein [candidate division KSB1 bacterium]
MKKRILLMIVLCCSVLSAQETLDLDQCINIALQNNSQLRIAETQVDISGTQVVSARSNWLPTVGLSSGPEKPFRDRAP